MVVLFELADGLAEMPLGRAQDGHDGFGARVRAATSAVSGLAFHTLNKPELSTRAMGCPMPFGSSWADSLCTSGENPKPAVCGISCVALAIAVAESVVYQRRGTVSCRAGNAQLQHVL